MISTFSEYKDIERIIIKYYKQFHCNKFSKLNKKDKIFEKQTTISLLKKKGEPE